MPFWFTPAGQVTQALIVAFLGSCLLTPFIGIPLGIAQYVHIKQKVQRYLSGEVPSLPANPIGSKVGTLLIVAVVAIVGLVAFVILSAP